MFTNTDAVPNLILTSRDCYHCEYYDLSSNWQHKIELMDPDPLERTKGKSLTFYSSFLLR